MRHNNHRFQLGIRRSHRDALMANLTSSLLIHDRICTTQAKAKAMRPFVEKIITLAKKFSLSTNIAEKTHYRRQATSKVRNHKAVSELFDCKVKEFLNRKGGYTRIYKLALNRQDAAKMAYIEIVKSIDKGYQKKS